MTPLERMDLFLTEHRDALVQVPAEPGVRHDLWAALGAAGLLGLYLPAEHGGLGGDTPTLSAAGARLAEVSGDLGLTMSWTAHNLMSRFLIARLGTPAQQAELLPAMAGGKLVTAVAISEPDAGAHPKLLRTTARREGDDYLIDGTKQWVTNGTSAGIYVVLAITGEQNGRKAFSALLVPRDAPGLRVEAMTEFTALHSSPHARLHLESCRVPRTALLGAEGEGFETIGRPLREVEDAINLGALSGGLHALLRRLARGANGEDEALVETLGSLQAQVDGMAALAQAVATAMDAGTRGEPLHRLTLAGRAWARQFQSQVEWVRKGDGLQEDGTLGRWTQDLDVIINLSRRIDQGRLHRMGEALIKEVS